MNQDNSLKNKNTLRLKMRQVRRELNSLERSEAAQRVLYQLRISHYFQSAQTIGIYYPLKDELDVKEVVKYCWEVGKKVYLPVYKNNTITFYLYSSETKLKKTLKGIYEPDPINGFKAQSLDVLCVPSVAVDNQGFRLGYGAGAYDRFLAKDKAQVGCLVYLAYACNKVLSCYPEAHDIKADHIVLG